jgi:hypothetical protein
MTASLSIPLKNFSIDNDIHGFTAKKALHISTDVFGFLAVVF